MKYEVSEADWNDIRKLLADIRLLLNSFEPIGGRTMKAVADDSLVFLLDSRCERLMSAARRVHHPAELAEMAVSAAVDAALSEVAAQVSPDLASEAKTSAIIAAEPFIKFIDKTDLGRPTYPELYDIGDIKTVAVRIQTYRYDRGFKDGVRGDPPAEVSEEYRQGWQAGRQVFLSKDGDTESADTANTLLKIKEVPVVKDRYEQYIDPVTGEYLYKRKKE